MHCRCIINYNIIFFNPPVGISERQYIKESNNVIVLAWNLPEVDAKTKISVQQSNGEIFPGSTARGVGSEMGEKEANKGCLTGQVALRASGVPSHQGTVADRIHMPRATLRQE